MEALCRVNRTLQVEKAKRDKDGHLPNGNEYVKYMVPAGYSEDIREFSVVLCEYLMIK